MRGDLDSNVSKQVLEFLNFLSDGRPIVNKLDLKVKRKIGGSTYKFKACLVVKGYT